MPSIRRLHGRAALYHWSRGEAQTQPMRKHPDWSSPTRQSPVVAGQDRADARHPDLSHAALPQGHLATLAAHRPHGGAGGPKGPRSNPRNPLQGSQVCTGICPLYLSGTGLTCLCLPLPIPPIAYFCHDFAAIALALQLPAPQGCCVPATAVLPLHCLFAVVLGRFPGARSLHGTQLIHAVDAPGPTCHTADILHVYGVSECRLLAPQAGARPIEGA